MNYRYKSQLLVGNSNRLRQLSILFACTLTAVMLVTTTPGFAQAVPQISDDDRMALYGTWVNWDPEQVGCSADSSAPVDTPAAMMARAKIALKYLISSTAKPKFTAVQAAGIVGNLMWESGVEPTKEEASGGGGYGLAQ